MADDLAFQIQNSNSDYSSHRLETGFLQTVGNYLLAGLFMGVFLEGR